MHLFKKSYFFQNIVGGEPYTITPFYCFLCEGCTVVSYSTVFSALFHQIVFGPKSKGKVNSIGVEGWGGAV